MIVAGGEHATALSEYILRDCPAIDYVVRSEGEFTFLELVHHVFTRQGPCTAHGLGYLDHDGRYIDTGPARRIADFENLPRPAWDLTPGEFALEALEKTEKKNPGELSARTGY